MKAISLWQPWASAIALGAKKFETRSWGTAYRGPIAIHAARRPPDREIVADIWARAGLAREVAGENWVEEFPLGAVVAVARLAQVWPTERLALSESIFTTREGILGDWTTGRFAWELREVITLRHPVRCRGRQGLFTLDGDAAAEVWKAIP